MSDEWMTPLGLRLTADEFRRLPRNAAYKYDYLNGEAILTPWPRHYHAVLTLPALTLDTPPDYLALRLVEPDDLEALVSVFAEAFARHEPFAALAAEARAEAARACLRRTFAGEDGPWVRQVSLIGIESATGRPVGAALVTLLPDGDPCAADSYYWNDPPPEDCVARGLGRPHLTWIFVTPLRAARGVGTALLHAAAQGLTGLGYRSLCSTFLLGNEASVLWHWRNGFQLLPYPASLRRLGRPRQAPGPSA